MHDSLDLGSVPFYWRTKASANQIPRDIPNRLPFAFSFDSNLQLIIQQRNSEVLHWLSRVYSEDANVGYLQEGHALASSYGGEFLDFFQRACRVFFKNPTSAADIGCGGVYLLQQIRATGMKVKGIDPSPVTVAAGRKAGIEIIQSFYPATSLDEKFDVLFHYDVLEHIEDPVAFLRAHRNNLSPDGGLVFAVPDCTHHIALGDVSMVLHEHLNYFDKTSLAATVRAAGFEPVLLETAKHGGVLMCCAVAADIDRLPANTQHNNWSKFTEFSDRAQESLLRFSKSAACAVSKEMGLYVPLRAFPYLSHVPENVRLRFFDDDPGLHGRYFDGFDVVVENRAQLEESPPDYLMVCSLVFGDRILGRLSEQSRANMVVTAWNELFPVGENGAAEVASDSGVDQL
jgi:2-polyprenyl-3-methyl-5-hydroxy-6-metoxy-1,4-benzoquinol methylase